MYKGNKRVFDDVHKLEELIVLLNQNYSYASIGRHFGVDHSSILHQARKLDLHRPYDKLNPKGRLNQTKYQIKREKRKIPERTKYIYPVLDEYDGEDKVNRGKLSYKEYLREDKRRREMSVIHSLLDKKRASIGSRPKNDDI